MLFAGHRASAAASSGAPSFRGAPFRNHVEPAALRMASRARSHGRRSASRWRCRRTAISSFCSFKAFWMALIILHMACFENRTPVGNPLSGFVRQPCVIASVASAFRPTYGCKHMPAEVPVHRSQPGLTQTLSRPVSALPAPAGSRRRTSTPFSCGCALPARSILTATAALSNCRPKTGAQASFASPSTGAVSEC